MSLSLSLSLFLYLSLSGVVCRLCRLLCSIVSHATGQRCVVSHATEQRCVACYRAPFVTEQTCGVVSVAWRCFRRYHLSCVCVFAHIVLSGPSEMMMMMMMMNVLP